MNKAIVYSSTTCPYCVKAKRLLNMLNIEFEDINCDENFDEMKHILNLDMKKYIELKEKVAF